MATVESAVERASIRKPQVCVLGSAEPGSPAYELAHLAVELDPGVGGKAFRAGPRSQVKIATMEYSIEHEDDGAKGAFFLQNDGRRLAEMTYSRTNPSLIIIDHTDVDASLGGQGVGRKLLQALVGWVRSAGIKVIPLCPFAKAQFEKDASIRDVLV
jgi:predicted GNAT family acetyltransferase